MVLDNLKHDIDRIEKCSEIFCDRSGWNSDKLRSIASEVKNFQTSWKKLSEDGNIVKGTVASQIYFILFAIFGINFSYF